MVDLDEVNVAMMDEALALYRHWRECKGASVAAGAHCLIACGLFALGEDLPVPEALEQLDNVWEILAEREAELRRRVN